LSEVDIFSIDERNKFENIVSKKRNLYNKNVAFDHDLIASLEKEPKDLSIWTIINQIQFLSENKLRSDVFEVELYKRLVRPISLIAMILLAMLFIFGSTRDVTLGRKIFFGVAIGLSFELISRVGGAMALSFEFSPLLSSFIPALSLIIIAFVILINKSTN
jgi:lipopolysaccharide export system permease protein